MDAQAIHEAKGWKYNQPISVHMITSRIGDSFRKVPQGRIAEDRIKKRQTRPSSSIINRIGKVLQRRDEDRLGLWCAKGGVVESVIEPAQYMVMLEVKK